MQVFRDVVTGVPISSADITSKHVESTVSYSNLPVEPCFSFIFLWFGQLQLLGSGKPAQLAA